MDIAILLLDRITSIDAVGYDPQPPFDAGSPHKAPTSVADFFRRTSRLEPEPV